MNKILVPPQIKQRICHYSAKEVMASEGADLILVLEIIKEFISCPNSKEVLESTYGNSIEEIKENLEIIGLKLINIQHLYVLINLMPKEERTLENEVVRRLYSELRGTMGFAEILYELEVTLVNNSDMAQWTIPNEYWWIHNPNKQIPFERPPESEQE